MAVGFYFDMTRCTGCRACQVVCKDKNRLEVGYIFRHANTYSVGKFPDVKGYSMSTGCNHCDSPACVENCPTGAMYKADDGTVISDSEICIGCGTCVASCPYSVPVLLPQKISGKCDGCYAIRAEGGQTACTAGCPNRALVFGDVDELKKKYGSDLVSGVTVWPEAATMPNIYIKAKDIALGTGETIVNW